MGRINKKSIKKSALKLMLLFWTFTIFWGMSSSMAATSDWIKTYVNLGSLFMDQYFSMVHFSVWGNDFWWGILWLPVKQTEKEPVEIIISWDENKKIYCASQVRGFYWNSQRWDSRIWPLDAKTHDWLTWSEKDLPDDEKKYVGLVLSWGWYTTCAESSWGAQEIINALNWEILPWSSSDSYWIYGAIAHYYSGSNADPMYLVAWMAYDPMTNRMLTWENSLLTCSLQRLNNSYPFGYIYDDYGHMGLVWARVISWVIQSPTDYTKAMNFHKWVAKIMNSNTCTWADGWTRLCCMNDVFSYDWKDLQYIAGNCENDTNCTRWQQIENFSCTKSPDCLKALLAWWEWNPASTTVFSLWIKGIVWLTDEITDAQKQYYENNQFQSTLLLRTDSSISSTMNATNKIAERLCRGKWEDPSRYWNDSNLKDITCISGTNNVTLSAKKMAWKTVIIKGANLQLNNTAPYNFTSSDEPINLFIDWGNLFLDNTWTLQSFDPYWYPTETACTDCSQALFLKGNFIINWLLLWGLDGTETFKNKLYIHGKLISYNTLTIPTEGRKNTIDAIVPKATEPKYWSYSWVALMRLFTWTCDAVGGTGSDGTWCKGASSTDNTDSQLVDKAFWLVDVDFDSLFKNSN